jgi:hypothetical protein
VAIAPSGERTRWSETDSVRSLTLREQGFYELRDANSVAANRVIAVNPDATESELGAFAPDELVRAVSPAGGSTTALATTTLSVAEREKRQTLWWYVLVAALLLLAAESLLSNRLSRAARRDVAPADARMDHA